MAAFLGFALLVPHGARADDAGEDVSPTEQFFDATSQFVVEQAKKIVAERYFYPSIELSPFATLQLSTNSDGKVNYAYDIRNLAHQDDLAIVEFSIP